MGEEDDSKKQHVIFGSAGMAASGMMAGSKAKPKPKPKPPEPATEEEPEKSDEVEAEIEEPPALPGSPVFTGLKAAVIGHTGSGDFGHGLDIIFQRLDGVRLFALVDFNAETVDDASVHAGAPAAYSDLTAMLEEESPDLISVASTHTAARFDQIKAALDAGCHVFSEAPLARTLKEADEINALASSADRTLAVRYPLRLDPHVMRFQSEMESLIGELCQISVIGACDESSGGEDLLLNGVPLFDLVRRFAGEVSYCTASISKDGMAAIADDFHESESVDLGPLLGDTIHAEFEMDSGIRVSFVSDQKLQSVFGSAGIEFIGTKSKMRLTAGAPATLSYLTNPNPTAATRTESWVQWPKTSGEYHTAVDHLTGENAANRLLVKDWIAAISDHSEPAPSGNNAAKALEMAHGIWQAGVTMKRAYFPLANRLHPLSEESQ